MVVIGTDEREVEVVVEVARGMIDIARGTVETTRGVPWGSRRIRDEM